MRKTPEIRPKESEGGVTLGEQLETLATEDYKEDYPLEDPHLFKTNATGAGTSGGFGSFRPFQQASDSEGMEWPNEFGTDRSEQSKG